MIGVILAATIELVGVTGADLRARAYFDANNVKVGDPLVLTIDFVGEADFAALHPPALSKFLNRRDWKLDDKSAKTDTFRDVRRLVYRVRPMREGVLWFPEFDFRYVNVNGSEVVVRSNKIPVHAKLGSQVVVEEMGEADENGYPKPPALVDVKDGDFAWKKAMCHPSAAAFSQLEGTEARLNEATCAIREGNWAQAMKIYNRLEWSIGQTPTIEKGIVAALAVRYQNPTAVLPIWRELGRPVLKYAWAGRLGIFVGAILAFALVFWLLGRIIRLLAAVGLALVLMLPLEGMAQDIFQQMEEHMRQMRQQMTSSFSFSFGGEEAREPVKVEASLSTSVKQPKVGDQFDFIIALEYPKTASVGSIRLIPSERFGLAIVGDAKNLADGVAANSSNVVKRIAIPARYDVPFKGKIAFAIEGMVTGRQERKSKRGFMSSFSFSNSFRADTAALEVEVEPLSKANQPADFAGIVSAGLTLVEQPDLIKVETNDVVTITYKLKPNGYVPTDYLLPGAAFEWIRMNNAEGRPVEIEYRRFFVADGAPTTPELSLSYYDLRSKIYKRVQCGATPLKYVKER